MSAPYPVSPQALRRLLIERQRLGAPSPVPASPAAVLELIRALECVQIDPVAAVERNQHLVLGARLPGYAPAMLNRLLAEGRVFEYIANAACVIPMEDYPLLAPTRRRISERYAGAIEELRPVVAEVLERLHAEGPLPARAFETEQRVSGYWENQGTKKTKATSHVLNLLLDSGQVMVARREGNDRYFGLPGQIVPPDLLRQSEEIGDKEAAEALLDKYLRAYRAFDTSDFRFGWRKLTAPERRATVERRVQAGSVVPLAVEGVKRQYYVLAEDLDRLKQLETAAEGEEGPIRFLPPLDNLLWRRERLTDLFGFDYTWEVYIPPAKRRYGYYTMPILAGDRLIGRIDPRLNRHEHRLEIGLLELEPGVQVTAALRKAINEALGGFAHFHGVSEISLPPKWRKRTPRDRP